MPRSDRFSRHLHPWDRPHHRGCAALDGVGDEAMPVHRAARHGYKQRARLHLARIGRHLGDFQRGQRGTGDGAWQRLEQGCEEGRHSGRHYTAAEGFIQVHSVARLRYRAKVAANSHGDLISKLPADPAATNDER